MANLFEILTFGEAMALFVANECGPLSLVEGYTRRVAGAELNVAIGLARLGHKVGWISRVGRDSFGQFVLDSLAQEGIDTGCVTVDASRPTGMMLKTRTMDGSDPQTEYFRKGSAASALSVEDFADEYVKSAKLLHVTGISPALSQSTKELSFHAMRTMREAGKAISFDPNLRPSLWQTNDEMVSTVNALASHADIVLPGLGEGKILTGYSTPQDIASFYLDKGAKTVIVKRGAHGAYVRSEGVDETVPAYRVEKVIDTVGAGDGFAVGVISAILAGRTLPEAVARGNWIGALAVQAVGDSEGLPTRDRLVEHEKLRGFQILPL